MFRCVSALLVGFLFTGGAPVFSQRVVRSHADSLALCDSPNTGDLIACALAGNRDAEDSLTRTFAEVRALVEVRMQRASPSERAEVLRDLATAQQAWEAFRRAECRWQDHWEEGTMFRIAWVACSGDMARARTATLRDVIDGIRSE